MTMTAERDETTAASVPGLTITADRKELAAAITWAAKALPKRPVVPTLAGMRLEVRDGRLELGGFDYETTCTASVAGSDAVAGTLLAAGHELLAAVKAMPAGKTARVTLTAGDGTLTVTSGAVTSRVRLLDLGEYPQLPAMPQLAGLADAGALAGAIGRVAAGASRDDTLRTLTCVNVTCGSDGITLQATDRYRAHEEAVPWVADTQADAMLIPREVLAMAAKAMGKLGVISVHAGGGFAALSAGPYAVISRTVTGEYPRMARLWARDADIADRITADAGTLAAALTRAAGHLERNAPSVIVECSPDSITVLAVRDGSEAYRVTVPATGTPGYVVRCAFNPRYLADACTAGTVTLGLPDVKREEATSLGGGPVVRITRKPAVITCDGAPGFRALLMSIRNYTADQGARELITAPVAA